MNDIVETIEYKRHDIEIHYDDGSMNPREDWDNLFTMVCFHNRYNLGDKHDLTSDMFDGWEEVKTHLEKEEGALYIRPLYLYDHSGITISMSEFGDRWDSGCIGFIYTTRKAIKDFMGWDRVTKNREPQILAIREGEVEVYDQYLRGEVYGYVIEDIDESCWGFFGYDHGKSGLLESAQSNIDYYVNQKKKEHFAKLRAWIKNKVPVIYREPLCVL